MKGFNRMCGFVGTHGCFMRLVTAGHTNKTYTPLLRKVLCVFSTAQTSAAIISSKCLVLCDTCTELVRQVLMKSGCRSRARRILWVPRGCHVLGHLGDDYWCHMLPLEKVPHAAAEKCIILLPGPVRSSRRINSAV